MAEKEAMFYKRFKSKIVQCQLCPHFCVIKEGKRGNCGARQNKFGKLISLVYGKPCSLSLDPIEKKPFLHFFPGEKTFSLATAGCNLSCKHCQNWQISQAEIESIPFKDVSPEEIIELTKKNHSNIISFTYTEPTIFYEYMLDIAKLAKKSGIKTCMVTNGFINPEPLKLLVNYIDAFNVDLKSIKEKFYENICGARLEPVLGALKIIYKSGKHLEITNLLIPRNNDSDEEIANLVEWIKKNLDENVPIHFSAFYPCYNMAHLTPTEKNKVIHAAELAVKLGMKNVHTGNI